MSQMTHPLLFSCVCNCSCFVLEFKLHFDSPTIVLESAAVT
jgi:hypothetical protein